ncbi:MAG: carbohydrate ABC transporter permease [Bacteroidota bacterium]
MRPVGFLNYQQLFADSNFWKSFINSLVWTLGNLVLQLTLPTLVALFLNRKFFGRNFTRSIILTPWIIPAIVAAIIWRWLLEPTVGIINLILQSLHWVNGPISFLGEPNTAMISLICVNTWRFAPLGIVLILASLQTIPHELYEAAHVDGATPVQEFTYITFPLLGNVVWFVGLLASIWTFNIFDLIWLMTTGGPGTATQTIPVLIYRTAFKTLQMGMASAMAIISSIFLIGLGIIYFRYMKPKDMERG